MTHIDLFSGIGGFALACKWAGIETIQFVEIDPFCQKVLKKNFPGVPIHDDITSYKWGGQSAPFILTGGFPCQPFSCAGKRRGKEDDRYLWPEMLRVVGEAMPSWIVGENVAGFIDMGLDDCISDLENTGYEVQAFIVPACAVNAPHRRDRVWIVGNAGLLGQEKCKEQATGVKQSGQGVVSHAISRGQSGQGKSGRQGYSEENTTREAVGSINCSEREEGNWDIEPDVGRVAHGVSDRVHRLKALGNAIVPQVAYQIIRAIISK